MDMQQVADFIHGSTILQLLPYHVFLPYFSIMQDNIIYEVESFKAFMLIPFMYT